jgi:hypothetical protein
VCQGRRGWVWPSPPQRSREDGGPPAGCPVPGNVGDRGRPGGHPLTSSRASSRLGTRKSRRRTPSEVLEAALHVAHSAGAAAHPLGGRRPGRRAAATMDVVGRPGRVGRQSPTPDPRLGRGSELPGPAEQVRSLGRLRGRPLGACLRIGRETRMRPNPSLLDRGQEPGPVSRPAPCAPPYSDAPYGSGRRDQIPSCGCGCIVHAAGAGGGAGPGEGGTATAPPGLSTPGGRSGWDVPSDGLVVGDGAPQRYHLTGVMGRARWLRRALDIPAPGHASIGGTRPISR